MKLTREDEESKQFKGQKDFEPDDAIEIDEDVLDALSYDYSYDVITAPFEFILGIDGVLTIENIGMGLPEICDLVAVNPDALRRGSSGGGGGGGGRRRQRGLDLR